MPLTNKNTHLRVVRYFLLVFYALKVDEEMLQRLFLMGLKKHGKGDWRNISRNFVMTRTPTQVASHAQKYFIRQLSGAGGKGKRRASIHDITTVNLIETSTSRTSRNKTKKSSSCCSSSSQLEKRMNMMMPSSQSHSPSVQKNNSAETQFQWTHQQQQPMDALSDPVFHDKLFMSNLSGICDDLSSYGNGDDLSSF